MDEAPKDQPQVRRVGRPPKVKLAEPVIIAQEPADESKAKAQALASRIWAGQSPDTIARSVRIERIRKALEAQGLSMEGVIL